MGQQTPVFRGAKLPQSLFDDYQNKLKSSENVILDGYVSTSESIDVAVKFMFRGINKEDIPVLY